MRTYGQPAIEEHARIDIRIMCAKVRGCVSQFEKTRDLTWLNKIRTLTKKYDQLWTDIERHADSIADMPDFLGIRGDRN